MRTEPVSVLFVCTGNICRSPVAERMLKARTVRLDFDIAVSSAGTRALNGKPMHPESVRVLRDRGIDANGFASRLLTPAMANDADVILGLSRDHRAAARQLVPVRWRSMYALREVTSAHSSVLGLENNLGSTGSIAPTDPSLDIEDPIGRAAEVFDSVAEDIEATMDGLVVWLKHRLVQHNTVQQVAK